MIVVDSRLPTPAYEQIKLQVMAQRQSGHYPPGHRLPPVRTLAAELGLAANTVAKAYRDLEELGVIETRGRAGSFIAAPPDGATQLVTEAARAFTDAARRAGLAPEQAIAVVRAAWAN